MFNPGIKTELFNLLCILAGMLLCTEASCQDPTGGPRLLQGEDEVIRAIEMLPRVFACDSSGYYALTRTARYGISHYGNDLMLTRGDFLKVNEKLKERQIVNLLQFRDTIYLFFFTEGINFRTLYAQVISKDSLAESGAARELMRVRFIAGRKPVYGTILSRDESTLLVYSSTINYSRKQGILEMMVYSNLAAPMWKNRFIYAYERVPRHDQHFTVDPEGNVCMLDRYYETPRPNISGRKNIHMILSVTGQGTRETVTRIGLKDRYIKNILIEPAGESHVVCSGFSSDNDLEGTVSGIFYFRVNTEMGTVQNFREHGLFPGDFTSGELFGLHIDHLIHRDEGYSFLVAEQSFRERHQRYQNLLVCLFNDDGEMRWQRVFPKVQSYQQGSRRRTVNRDYQREPVFYGPDGTPNDLLSRNLYNSPGYPSLPPEDDWQSSAREDPGIQSWNYSSYALMDPIDGNWIGLVFNDHIKNRDPEKRKQHVFSPTTKSFLQIIRVEETGYLESSVPYERERRSKPVPLPAFGYGTLNGRIIFPAAKQNNTFRMMELAY